MNSSRQSLFPSVWVFPWKLLSAVALVCCICEQSSAVTNRPVFLPDSRYTVVQPTPGGLSAHPDITSCTVGAQLTLTWNGFAPPYTVEKRSELGSGAWTTLLWAGTEKTGVVPLEPQAFYRITGGTPEWQGQLACTECHDTGSRWRRTAHAAAWTTLNNVGSGADSSCLACHTTGFGKGGFVDNVSTPRYAGVQCESCHGPVSTPHNKNNEQNQARLPLIAMSSKVCGGCHNGATPHPNARPTYEEWASSAHATVNEQVKLELTSAVAGTAVSSANSCAPCHSGWVRVNMRQMYPNPLVFDTRTWDPAWGAAAAEVGVTCVTCHDQHGMRFFTNIVDGTLYTNQLHNPLASLGPYSYSPSLSFAAQFNRYVNVCGQCHNMRGATRNDTDSPPHRSSQYNILIGSGGVTLGGELPPQSEHRLNQRQCAGCHTHRRGGPDPRDPTYAGHTFEARIEACATCHTETTGPDSPAERLLATQTEISALIAQVKQSLDDWAVQRAPLIDANFQTYGSQAWEYTAAGSLSGAGSGPPPALQAKIPQAIKDARFNLYLVHHDGSLGIHNRRYARYLLETAQIRVGQAP